MLKDNAQMTLDLSPYQGLYEAIIPQNHILRKLKDNIYARTNSAVAAAANTELEEGFSYNKDAHMLQCPGDILRCG